MDPEEVKLAYNLNLLAKPLENYYDGIIIAVAHKMFYDIGINKIKTWCKNVHIIYDVKSVFDKRETDASL